jgi:hypothetical protein
MTMRITFMQSGGFAGGIRGCRIDVAGLADAERQELEGLVDSCGIVDSFERFSATGRDLRQYDLAIERDAAPLRLSCDERSLPDAARRLVAFLSARATPQPVTFQMPPAGAAAAINADWGLFDGDVVARWEDDGREMTLVEDFAYVDPRQVRWAAAAGSVVNGASIPRAFWSLIGGPFEGRFRKASVVHDVACVTRERRWQDVHRMFHDACRCGGVGAAKAATMYYAVYHFGPRWRIEERTTVVAGAARRERVVYDETPAAATGAQVSAIEAYLATHEVAPEAIPTLDITPSSGLP